MKNGKKNYATSMDEMLKRPMPPGHRGTLEDDRSELRKRDREERARQQMEAEKQVEVVPLFSAQKRLPMPNAGASAFDRKITQTLGEFDKAQHFLEDRHMIGITSSPSPAINRQSSSSMLGGGGGSIGGNSIPMMGGGTRQQPSAYPYGGAGPPQPQQQHNRHPFAKTMDNKFNHNNGRGGVGGGSSSGYPIAKQPQSQLNTGSGQMPPQSMMMNGAQRFQQQQQQQLHQQHNGRSALPPLSSGPGAFVKPTAPMHQMMHPATSSSVNAPTSTSAGSSMMQPPSIDSILSMFKSKVVEPLSAIEATPRVELSEQHSAKAHKYVGFVPLGGGFPSRPMAVAPMLDDLPAEPEPEPLLPEPVIMTQASLPAVGPQIDLVKDLDLSEDSDDLDAAQPMPVNVLDTVPATAPLQQPIETAALMSAPNLIEPLLSPSNDNSSESGSESTSHDSSSDEESNSGSTKNVDTDATENNKWSLHSFLADPAAVKPQPQQPVPVQQQQQQPPPAAATTTTTNFSHVSPNVLQNMKHEPLSSLLDHNAVEPLFPPMKQRASMSPLGEMPAADDLSPLPSPEPDHPDQLHDGHQHHQHLHQHEDGPMLGPVGPTLMSPPLPPQHTLLHTSATSTSSCSDAPLAAADQHVHHTIIKQEPPSRSPVESLSPLPSPTASAVAAPIVSISAYNHTIEPDAIENVLAQAKRLAAIKAISSMSDDTDEATAQPPAVSPLKVKLTKKRRTKEKEQQQLHAGADSSDDDGFSSNNTAQSGRSGSETMLQQSGKGPDGKKISRGRPRKSNKDAASEAAATASASSSSKSTSGKSSKSAARKEAKKLAAAAAAEAAATTAAAAAAAAAASAAVTAGKASRSARNAPKSPKSRATVSTDDSSSSSESAPAVQPAAPAILLAPPPMPLPGSSSSRSKRHSPYASHSPYGETNAATAASYSQRHHQRMSASPASSVGTTAAQRKHYGATSDERNSDGDVEDDDDDDDDSDDDGNVKVSDNADLSDGSDRCGPPIDGAESSGGGGGGGGGGGSAHSSRTHVPHVVPVVTSDDDDDEDELDTDKTGKSDKNKNVTLRRLFMISKSEGGKGGKGGAKGKGQVVIIDHSEEQQQLQQFQQQQQLEQQQQQLQQQSIKDTTMPSASPSSTVAAATTSNTTTNATNTATTTITITPPKRTPSSKMLHQSPTTQPSPSVAYASGLATYPKTAPQQNNSNNQTSQHNNINNNNGSSTGGSKKSSHKTIAATDATSSNVNNNTTNITTDASTKVPTIITTTTTITTITSASLSLMCRIDLSRLTRIPKRPPAAGTVAATASTTATESVSRRRNSQFQAPASASSASRSRSNGHFLTPPAPLHSQPPSSATTTATVAAAAQSDPEDLRHYHHQQQNHRPNHQQNAGDPTAAVHERLVGTTGNSGGGRKLMSPDPHHPYPPSKYIKHEEPLQPQQLKTEIDRDASADRSPVFIKKSSPKTSAQMKHEMLGGSGSVAGSDTDDPQLGKQMLNTGTGAGGAMLSGAPPSADEYEQAQRRKRSSSVNSSPYKDKKRKIHNEMQPVESMCTNSAQAQQLLALPVTSSATSAAAVAAAAATNHDRNFLAPPMLSAASTALHQQPFHHPLHHAMHLPPMQLHQPQLVYRSYFESADDSTESNGNPTNLLFEAQNLKHAADAMKEHLTQAMKYLEAVLYFLLTGTALERSSKEDTAFTMFSETLNLIKCISSKLKSKQNFDTVQGTPHTKVVILSLRCQSLILLKLYKMRRNEVRDCQRAISDYMVKSTPKMTNGKTPSPLSPTNSVCSQSSGSATPPCQLVPAQMHGAFQRQTEFFNYLSNSHELWEQADTLVYRGHHTEFFVALDREYGPITLHSTLPTAVTYVKAGLQKLKKDHNLS